MRFLTKKLPIILFLMFNSLVANAALEQTEMTLTKQNSALSTSALVETLLGLLLVLAIIVLLAWLVKRTNRFTSSANGQMKILGGLSLGPRERAVLIQVGDQQLLVGVTSQHVQTLHVLDTPLSTTENTEQSMPFSARLQDMIKQRGQS
jgi:flagellar protein FliO/FliZ